MHLPSLKSLWLASVAVCLGFPLFTFATPRLDSLADRTLVPKKGDGAVGLDLEFHHGRDFFDTSGNRQSNFSDGSHEEYFDFAFTFGTSYGLTDELMIWLDFPILYRKETSSLNAEDYGLGDVRAGARYRVWQSESEKFQVALELAGKFPSGDSDLAFADSTRGKHLHLPLGSGNSDITPALFAAQRPFPFLVIEESVGYAFRFNALVEFLQTDPIGQTAPDGSIVLLPIGNLKIDWGDEIEARLRVLWKISKRFQLAAEGRYLHRRPTQIRSFAFSSTATGIDSTPQTLQFTSGYIIYTRPTLFVHLTDSVLLRTSVEIPLFGDGFPTIPFVDSLLGNRYQLEVRYVF